MSAAPPAGTRAKRPAAIVADAKRAAQAIDPLRKRRASDANPAPDGDEGKADEGEAAAQQQQQPAPPSPAASDEDPSPDDNDEAATAEMAQLQARMLQLQKRQQQRQQQHRQQPSASPGGFAATAAASPAAGDIGVSVAAVPGASAAALVSEADEIGMLRADLAGGPLAIQQLQQQLLQLQQRPPAPSTAPTDFTSLLLAMQQQQQQQLEAAEKRQQEQASRQIMVEALGRCPTFNGKAAAGTHGSLQAHEWLQRTRNWFHARDTAMNITQQTAVTDLSRIATVVTALEGDAQRWYTSLPAASKPTTWDAFEKCVRERYCNGAAEERLRLDVLKKLVVDVSKLRERFTATALEAFLSRFQEIASTIPETFLTIHGKLDLLAQGLPSRYTETVLKEDAKTPTPPLHEVARLILNKAAYKEAAASYAASSSSSVNNLGSAAPSDIALCMAAFGVDRNQASTYFAPQEGWAPHDTSGTAGSSSAPAAAASHSPLDGAVAQMLAAFTVRFGTASAGPKGGAGASSRRNAPADVVKDVPEQLVTARKEAGLCIKCGAAWYVPGGKGHNSCTCQKAADRSTSAAELQGMKRAGPKPKGSDF